jgi:predicted ATP-grasp superfamily ATP-dependent carboligase
LNVLIYEHASGGGFAEGAVSPGILAEGFGMLRSFVAGLKAAGHEVTVVIAAELSKFNPPLPADCMLPVFGFIEAQQAILKACPNVDAAYVIAPETGGTLQSLVEFIEQNGVPLLNSRSSAIRAVSDKAALNETLNRKGIKTPKTLVYNFSDAVKEDIKGKFSFPLVVKPLDGVGCSGLSLVKDESQIKGAIAKIDAESASDALIIQEYHRGEAVSVSLLCAGNKTLPVSLNKQFVNLGAPNENSSYMGGCMPFNHKLKREAFKAAEEVVACFSGLKGYVGVDLILTDEEPVVVDVNPRLTTSFVGLSRISSFNFADAIAAAALNGELPNSTAISGYACFSKIETSNPETALLQKVYDFSEVVSPPFPVAEYEKSCALVSGEGNTLDEAQFMFEEAKKRVLDIL